MINIPGNLQVKPELCLHSKQLFQPECSVRSHAPFFMYQLMDVGI